MAQEKNKIKHSIWMGSIAAAFAAATAVFIVMLQMERNMLADYEKARVFVVKDEIARGQVVNSSNYLQFLEEAEMDKKNIPQTAICDVSQIKEMSAVWNLEKGVIPTEGMFERMEAITGELKEPVIAGIRAEDIYQMVGGVLRGGDRIHIYSMDENGDVVLRWSNVYVQQAFDNAGNAILSSDSKTVAQRINLYMDKSDIQELYSEIGSKSVRVVKACE